jgi:WD40 repeat protein
MQLKTWLRGVALLLLTICSVAHAQYKDAVWIRGGNEALVNQIIFSSNSRYLASTTGEGSIKVWEMPGANLYREILTDAVSIAFSSGGDTIASGNRDGSIKLWRVSTGAMIRSWDAHSAKVNSVSFAPNSRLLASGSDDNLVKLWDTYNGTLVETFTGHTGIVNQVAFAPDGLSIASASDDVTIRLWNIATGDTIRSFKWRNLPARTVAFSSDGKYIAGPAGDCDGAHGGCGAIVFEVATGKTYRHYDYGAAGRHNLEVLSVAFSANGAFLASGSRDKTVYIYRLAIDSTFFNQPVSIRANGAINSVAFSPDGQYLAAGSDDKTIRLRNLTTGTVDSTLIPSVTPVRKVAYTSDGLLVAAGDDDGRLKVRNATNGSLTQNILAHTSPIQGLATSPVDPTRVATAGIDSTIKLWNVSTGSLLSTVATKAAASGQFTSIAFSPDGQFLLSGQTAPATGVKLWSTASNSVVNTYAGNTGTVRAVAFSPDGASVASGGDDFTLRVWNRATATSTFTKTDQTGAVNAIALSADGTLLASAGDDKTIRLYSFPSGTPITTLRDHTNRITGLAFSQDNKYLISSGEDKTVRLWKISTEDNSYTYSEYPSEQLAVAAFADRIASGTADGSVIVWRLQTSTVDLSRPVLISPANGSTDQPMPVTLQWNSVIGATSYTVQVATDTTFVTGIVFDEGNITDTTKLVTSLTPSKKYFYRVKAQGGGGSSPWSLVWSFTTGTGGPPAPALTFPEDKAKNVSTTVALTWQGVSGATYYKVQVARTPTFSSVFRTSNPTDPTYSPDGLNESTTYYWRVSAFNSIGQGPWSPVWSFTTLTPTSVDQPGVGSSGYMLEESMPNPFTSSTTIRFTLPKHAHARLSIVDERGREVATLVDRSLDAGIHTAVLDGSSLGAGSYFSRLEADGIVLTRKIVLVK